MNSQKLFGTKELYKILELEHCASINDGMEIINETY